MIYEVNSMPKSISYDFLDSVVSFAADYLNLDIDIIIEFKRLKKYQHGFCEYDEEETIITISNKLDVKEITSTLFHEMVHVKQHVNGQLLRGYIWLGKTYDCSYNELPWEVEAFELEQKMMSEFALTFAPNQYTI
jgi:Zn-dependent peptidase ImmA (M78 family)